MLIVRKKIFSIILVICIFLLSGCDVNEKTMDNINIYTTTYPIQFIINQLYMDHSKVYSVYPTGVDVSHYELSNRKLEEYSNVYSHIFDVFCELVGKMLQSKGTYTRLIQLFRVH